MIKDFDWVPFFEKLLSIICKLSKDNIQSSKLLYEYYKQLPENNYDFSNYKQIDPLTYISCVSRNIQNINKANLDFNIGIVLNKKGDGIPSFNPRAPQWVYAKELFYPSTKDSPELIFDNLWNFAREINNEKLNKNHFNKLLFYNSVTATKLSKIIFICKPNRYYPCDKNMVNYVNYKSPSNYDEFLNFQNICKQNYKNKKPYLVSYEAWLTRDIDKNKKGKIIMNERSLDFPKNQILYGPPGTGKTYNTVIKAMEMIKPSCIKYNEKGDVSNYLDVKKEFDKAKEKHQIEFVTFHQSYSYEEFVEGIKPDIENSELRYIKEDGIFKRICYNAAAKVTNDFETIYAKFISEFDENYEFKTSKSSFKVRINEKDGLTIRTGDNFDVENIGTITKEQIKNQTYTSEGRRIKLETVTKYLQNKYGLKFNQNKQKQRYVLIIDEINRGDVSKIFGELITLIEADKRIGGKYEMKVTLPYSKESFGVPDNLYIIGTMNTADRSIALLDTALRRRFDFVEMPPEPRFIKDKEIIGTEINPRNLLINLNNRIENYFDKDHKIGHSYLMDIESKEQLEKAYKNRILPLLNEYFYNDLETIGKVLNCKEFENKGYLEVLKETQKEYKKGVDD